MLKLLNWLWRQIYFSICWFYELSNSFHNYSVWGMKQGFAMIFWRFPKPSHFTESCANCHIQKNTLKRIKTRLTYNCAHLRSTKESMTVEFGKKECVKSSSSIKCQMFYCHYRVVLVDTWWCWVSMGRSWFVLGGTGSVWSGTGWYMMVLGQKKAVLVSTWWYWVSMGRYWLVLGCTGSALFGTAWY